MFKKILLAAFIAATINASAYAVPVDTDGDGISDSDEVLAGLPPTIADSDGDGIPDAADPDMDNDGILNVSECSAGTTTVISLVNGGFESPACLPGYNLCFPNESTFVGWKTTAPDHVFEVWPSGIWGTPGYEGRQFVELNANYVSTLYQDLQTTPGNKFLYSFAHRGRQGNDTMDFLLGPPNGSLVQQRRVTDGTGPWKVYSGLVVIPAGQAMTRFAFASISSACGSSCGNFLDAISFRPACLLDTDNDGIPDALDTDSDNDFLLDNVEGIPFSQIPDRDGDGWLDGQDNCVNIFNANQADMDHDGVGDICDTDRDGDSIVDTIDNCSDIPNTNQANHDFDSFGDACDPDADGDNILDAVDNCLLVYNPEQYDLDHDGYGDLCDNDDDGDNIIDTIDNCLCLSNSDQLNNDGDSLGDACDLDDDNDGIVDLLDNCKMISNETQSDIDHDGIGDICDLDIDDDYIANIEDNCAQVSNNDQKDTDGDNIGDACDSDIDNDGYTNNEDNCPQFPNETQSDIDLDGIGDVCDLDTDGDGFSNGIDNCVVNFNAGQEDMDGDGIGDICDSDADGDTIEDVNDNCLRLSNPDQKDLDLDTIGDLCDPDNDGDGIPNASDNCPMKWNTGVDTDSDGIGNECDPDMDDDGIPNTEEERVGTNPLLKDSDGDGYDDREELLKGSNPNSSTNVPPGTYSGGCSTAPVSGMSGIIGLLFLPLLRQRRRLLHLIATFFLAFNANAETMPSEKTPDDILIKPVINSISQNSIFIPGVLSLDGFYVKFATTYLNEPITWTSQKGETLNLVEHVIINDLHLGYKYKFLYAGLNIPFIDRSFGGSLPDTTGFMNTAATINYQNNIGNLGIVAGSTIKLPINSLSAPFADNHYLLSADASIQYRINSFFLSLAASVDSKGFTTLGGISKQFNDLYINLEGNKNFIGGGFKLKAGNWYIAPSILTALVEEVGIPRIQTSLNFQRTPNEKLEEYVDNNENIKIDENLVVETIPETPIEHEQEPVIEKLSENEIFPIEKPVIDKQEEIIEENLKSSEIVDLQEKEEIIQNNPVIDNVIKEEESESIIIKKEINLPIAIVTEQKKTPEKIVIKKEYFKKEATEEKQKVIQILDGSALALLKNPKLKDIKIIFYNKNGKLSKQFISEAESYLLDKGVKKTQFQIKIIE